MKATDYKQPPLIFEYDDTVYDIWKSSGARVEGPRCGGVCPTIGCTDLSLPKLIETNEMETDKADIHSADQGRARSQSDRYIRMGEPREHVQRGALSAGGVIEYGDYVDEQSKTDRRREDAETD